MKRPTADMVVRFAHRGRRRGTARVLITLAFGLVLLAPSADAQLPPEELTITQLDNVLRPHWVWVNDLSWNHMPDGRAYLLDADTGVLLGMISGGYSHSMLQVTPRGDRIAVPGIYFSRGSRGTRTDVVTLYDSRTLTPGREIIVPPKRLSALPFVGAMPLTDDGRFMLIYNFTPAQSVSVVDIEAGRFVGEYETPGCALAYPVGPRRFLMQCSDGSLQSASLSDAGVVTTGAASPPLFTYDNPATEKPVRIGATAWLFFNWLVKAMGSDPGGFRPFSTIEIAKLRSVRIRDVTATRADLLREIRKVEN